MDDAALPERFGEALDQIGAAGEQVGLSSISLWELAMLSSRDRIRLRGSLDTLLDDIELHPLVRVLPIDARIAAESTRLGDRYPRDPADRLIGATARRHGLRLMTADERIRRAGSVALA
jgi:PIN domain nuclease of toxin-antitoxin system